MVEWISAVEPSGRIVPPHRRSRYCTCQILKDVTKEEQRQDFDLVAALNRERYSKTGDMEIASRISSYEMAFRMQMSTPELLDLSKEADKRPRVVRIGTGNHSSLWHELPLRPAHG